MARVAVIGGGIGGLAVGLFLSRRGHSPTVFEREPRRASGRLDPDFLDWARPRVPQAIQPHAFLSPVREVLLAEAPDVYANMLRLGAFERHELDWFDERPPPRPGDEKLVAIRGRRIVVESALSAATSDLDIRSGTPVTGLVFAGNRVVGVRTGAKQFRADLVIDAAGRRSPVPEWLVRAGCRPPVVENHAIGIAYFSRWYRLPPDGPTDPGRVWEVSPARFAVGLVFPTDNRTFAVTIALPVNDPSRTALRDPAVFEAAARLFPSCRAWLDLAPEPLTDIQIMAGLDNRWTSLADAEGPVVTGLVGVGDAITHTNPTLGQGVALTLLAAQRIASTVDSADLEAGYLDWAQRTLKPWFDYQVAIDRSEEMLFAAGNAGGPMPQLEEGPRAHLMLAACALQDPVVMRARAQVRHLQVLPHQAYANEEVRAHIGQWLVAQAGPPAGPPGPSRAEWDAAVTSAHQASEVLV